MKRAWVLGVLGVFFMFGCGGGSSTPSTDTKGDIAEVCTGDGCAAKEDVAGDDISPDTAQVDTVLPDTGVDTKDVDECAGACKLGEIKCDGEKKYKECQEREDGCNGWGSLVFCPTSKVCSCEALIGEEVCSPEGEPCVCIPECDGKVCGPDGCGGQCGECELNCSEDGKTCSGDCLDCQVGDSICNGTKIQYCVNGAPENRAPCMKYGQVADCPENQQCIGNQVAGSCECEFLGCGEECCPQGDEYVCYNDSCCVPDCDGRECGADGCGGSCGQCLTSPYLICDEGTCTDECVSECTEDARKCSNDGLGYQVCELVSGSVDCFKWSLITGCGPSMACEGEGICECVPDCDGRDCGDDGCGGSCGECADYWLVCNDVSGQCECSCPDFEFPVCCTVGDTSVTFINECQAKCSGYLEECPKGACQDCPCTVEELEPLALCGTTDGTTPFDTYPNFCQLKCAIGSDQCNGLYDCPEVLYPGECKGNICEGCESQPWYQPLCTMDGGDLATAWNKCEWNMCLTGNELVCEGACPEAGSCGGCDSTCEPVCGLLAGQEVTYMNSCLRDCDGASLQSYEGPCCYCTSVETWVCSEDPDTGDYLAFENDCMQLCLAPESNFLYEIPLNNDGTPQISVCETCQCNLAENALDQVCGTDFQTYFNECALNCAGVDMYCHGQCGPEGPAECGCPVATGGLVVPEEIGTNDSGRRGVCDDEGNTWSNYCTALFNDANVIEDTWCDACSAPSDEGGCGGVPFSPYCCTDPVGGRTTYPNSCIPQKCNSYQAIEDCNKGSCCLSDEDCTIPGETCGSSGTCE